MKRMASRKREQKCGDMRGGGKAQGKVSRTMRERHLRGGPCMAWATPMAV